MLSEVPEGWSLQRFGEIASVKNGFAFKSKDFVDSQSGVAAVVRMSDLKKGTVEASSAKKIPLVCLEGLERFRLEAGDFVFGMSGSLSNYAVVPASSVPLYLNQRVGKLEAKSTDAVFLRYLYTSESFMRLVEKSASGNAQLNISSKQIESFEVFVPPANEQHRIAEILSSVDASIQATQAVIEQAERVKRGLMEELLTGGLGSEAIERGEVPEGYEAKKLGDLLEGIDGGVSVNSQSEPASLEEKGILKTSCVSNSFFDASENKVVPDEKEIQRLREPVQAETIIFSRMNTPKLVGANAFVPVSHENLFLPDRLWALKPVSKVKSRWLGFYMSYLFISGVFEALGTGTSGSMKNISKSKLKDVSIVVPSEVEQARVAEILSGVDDFVAKQKAIVEQYALTKRGLMDDLLTGKVRTV